MSPPLLEADYVIVGAGAAGLAFADTLLTDSDASIIIVDRRHQPGGHWIDAYPFVRLHAPSSLYGVNSRPLGSGRIDQWGANRGLLELASGAEILHYYDALMRERLLPSGRVTYLPSHECGDDGTVVSLLDGRRRQVRARRKVVDATHADSRVPATHPPSFMVAEDVSCVTPDELTTMRRPGEGFVLIGAGKTAMDTAVWLVAQGVEPATITWIRPRDAWMLNRANLQTDPESFERTVGAFAAELEAAIAATSVDDLFARLEAGGLLRRIDRNVVPTMYRCAIVSDAELAAMRCIRRVVRRGHVKEIHRDRIILDDGIIPTSPGHVHIHCSANGLPSKPEQPIFQPGRIVLQYLRRCSPTFSSALIAHLEATVADDAAKHALCGIVPVPNVPLDWLRMHVQEAWNTARWNQSPELRKWLGDVRLNAISIMINQVMRAPTAAQTATLERYRRAVGPAIAHLTRLLAMASDEATPV